MKKLLFLFFVLSIFVEQAIAQGCSVCTQTTNGMGRQSAQGLNNGILYLVAIPISFMLIVGYIWYKKNKHTI